jgi:hypothetical protein
MLWISLLRLALLRRTVRTLIQRGSVNKSPLQVGVSRELNISRKTGLLRFVLMAVDCISGGFHSLGPYIKWKSIFAPEPELLPVL